MALDTSVLRAAMELYSEKVSVFTRRHDIDPTNNDYGRDLRPSVTIRKVTGGFGSERGVRFADIRGRV